MLLSMNTGYYSNGVLIMNRKAIIIAYLKSWFILDFLSTFPYTYLIGWLEPYQEASSSNAVLKLLKILRFMRFLKLVRVLKVKKF